MNAAALHVLVVDDEADTRDALRGALEDRGHSVAEAESGDQALEMLEKQRLDAVLLDLNMEGLHGLDALLRIREMAPDLAVIVVTGENTTVNEFQSA